MRTYRLYAATSATTNNAASVQMVKPCRIKSIRWSGCVDSQTDNSEGYTEISLQAASQAAVNNSQGVIGTYRYIVNFTTSGLFICSIAKQDLVDVPIGIGEFIYLHFTLLAGTITQRADIFLDCTA